jgi:hypothetical protein
MFLKIFKLSVDLIKVFAIPATAVRVIASTEVDKTGASYYGEQTLHYIATNGESAVVQLRECISRLPMGKSGPQKEVCQEDGQVTKLTCLRVAR